MNIRDEFTLFFKFGGNFSSFSMNLLHYYEHFKLLGSVIHSRDRTPWYCTHWRLSPSL